MKIALKNIRTWLKRNKVFFETIASLLLSVMAIVVGFQANRIASSQIMLNKLEHLPIFYFEIEKTLDSSNSYSNDYLYVYNAGSPLNEFTCSIMVFSEIEYGEKDKESSTFLIPLIQYYPIHMPTGSPTNKLYTLCFGSGSDGNNYRVFKVSQDFNKLARDRGSFASFGIKRYLVLTYKDICDEEHKEVYFVNEINARKLTRQEGDSIIKYYKSELDRGNFLEITKIAPEMLIEKLKNEKYANTGKDVAK